MNKHLELIKNSTIFAKNNERDINMPTTATSQSTQISPLDALWALYKSQKKCVKHAFRSRILAEVAEEKKEGEMQVYAKKLSPETYNSICMMAKSVNKAANEVRQAEANGMHVGRNAYDFLAELEQEDV